MVSKAAERSRLTRTAGCLLSIDWYRPSRMDSRAVSAEQKGRYADCSVLKLDELKMWGRSRFETNLSSILDMVFKLEIGR